MGISWKGVVGAGLLAGLGFIVLQMLLMAWLTDDGLWTQPRLIATMVLGSAAATPPTGFDFVTVAVGLLVHFTLSLFIALVVGGIISVTGADLVWSVIGGAVFGMLLYIAGYYVLTAIVPSLEEGRSAVTLFNHILYGAALGALYRAISAPVEVPPTE